MMEPTCETCPPTQGQAMTEPEQWAVELWKAASDAASDNSVKWKPKANAAAALAIQAAFDELEARLVEALEQIKREARKNKPDPDRIYGITLAAIKGQRT